MSRQLPPIIPNSFLEEKLAKLFLKIFYFSFINPIKKELEEKKEILSNSLQTALEKAILSGKIIYENGFFKGKFSTSEIKELIKFGAIWDKRVNGYKLEIIKLPSYIISAINSFKIKSQILKENLTKKISSIKTDDILNELEINVLYEDILQNIDNTFKRNTINILEVNQEISQKQREVLLKEYFENLKLSIKDFQKEEVIKLRKMIEENVFAGYRAEYIKDIIEEEFDTTRKKAKFLAKQESSLLTSKYTSLRYKEAGIKKFKWSTSHDSRVREEHKELNGKIFYYNNLPIIDKRTGQRGLPGEAFGCRCVQIAIID